MVDGNGHSSAVMGKAKHVINSVDAASVDFIGMLFWADFRESVLLGMEQVQVKRSLRRPWLLVLLGTVLAGAVARKFVNRI